MIRTLRRKFILAAMLSLFLVLGLLIALINVLNYRSLVSEADETAALLAEIAESGLNPFLFGSKDDVNPRSDGTEHRQRRNFSGERPYQARYFTVTLSESGEVLDSDLNQVVTVDEQTAVQMAKAAAKKGREKGFSGDYRYLAVREPEGVRWLFLNREREIATFRTFLWTSVGISAAGFVMVLLLLMPLSARIVRPIAQSYEKQKQFITDAGHELKTPITIIRADADVLDEELPDSEWITDIRTQTDRLSSLTNDLIYLSRMEESDAKPPMLDFSLSDAVSDTAQPFQSVARMQNKSFTVQVQPMLTLRGDEKSVRKLVSVLLDNAMKYSPEGGSIALSLKKNGRQILLSVTNTATNIEKGNQDRLFDRFYRADASRNSETGGFGLGLAIAKAVVDAHKGKIAAVSPDGESLTVEATFAE